MAPWWMERIESLYEKYGDDAALILDALSAVVSTKNPSEATALELPSLSKIRNAIEVHQVKRLLARHMSEAIPEGQTGSVTEADAKAMIEADLAAPKTSEKVGAGGQVLAKVFAWFNANLPTIEADVKQILQFAISILPLLAAL
jgi:hypothetical protein